MKKGFTLAEVLITLGIIGVVAALTTPALIQNTGTAKVGPTLAKAVTTLELANQNMLAATDSPSIKASQAGSKTGKEYIETISDYMQITPYTDSGTKYIELLKDYNGNAVETGAPDDVMYLYVALGNDYYAITKTGVLYAIGYDSIILPGNSNDPTHKQVAGAVLIDTNGKKEPNRIGKDAFVFMMMQDGTLRPIGGNQWNSEEKVNKAFNWQNGTKDKCNENEVTSGWSCAGSIYENGLKVIY